jgi:gamma-glutamyltranspeptidase/glutathione hydrolase
VTAIASCHPAAAPVAEPAEIFPTTWTLPRPATSVEGRAGMVASGHPLASKVGADVLARGGNAIDAAVAVGFALAVVLPEAGNIGGGGYLVHRDATGEAVALDYRETAPAAATRDMYLDASGALTDKSRFGHLASGVPGSVAGLASMHERLGSLPWRELVEPAIELARGHVFDEARRENREAAVEKLQRFPASVDLLLPGGVLPEAGTTFANSDLARTLERIAEDGADGFYRGETADLIVAEMERGGGIITREDLAGYRPRWREPLRVEYRGHTLWTMPPSSSGGVTLAMILNILGGWDILPRFGSAELYDLEIEAMRWAYVDRNRWLGDPDFEEIPLDRLLSKSYSDELRRRIVPGKAGATPIEAAGAEGTQTTHYSIVDKGGNAAAVTTTINSLYGNGVVVAGAGFLLNDEMDDFAITAGTPNTFGLVGGEANAVAPGKRPLSSMTPTVLRDGGHANVMVIGSPGGPTIITAIAQVLLRVLVLEQTLDEAVRAPRLHQQWSPKETQFERGFDPLIVGALGNRRGHPVQFAEKRFASVQAIALPALGGTPVTVSDPRRGGTGGVQGRKPSKPALPPGSIGEP